MKTLLANALMALALFAWCNSSAAAEPGESLNGKWTNNMMTVNFDVAAGAYTGVAMGQEFSRKLTIVSDDGPIIIFKADDAKITVQKQDDSSIIMTKEGGVPMKLTKVK